MDFLSNIFSKDPLDIMLTEYNIIKNNGRRCDLLNRVRLASYFNLNDEYGRGSFLKIIDIASKQSTPIIVRFKCLMLLHSLIMSSGAYFEWVLDREIVLPEAKELQTKKSSSTKAVKTWFEETFIEYYNYLRKICLHCQLYEECKMRKKTGKNWEDTTQAIFVLINLMKTAFPMKQMILNVGRYYFGDYIVVADFNRIMTADLVGLYNSLSSLILQLYTNYKMKLTRQQAKQLLNIIDQVYIVHEQLYVFMYNRYYFAYMEVSQPAWFKLQEKDYEELKDYAENRTKQLRKNVTFDQIDLASFEQTYFGKAKGMRHEELPDL